MKFLIRRNIRKAERENCLDKIRRQQEVVTRRNCCFLYLTRNVMSQHLVVHARMVNGLYQCQESCKECVEGPHALVQRLLSCIMESVPHCMIVVHQEQGSTSIREEWGSVTVIKDTPIAENMILVIKNILLGLVCRASLGYAEQLLRITELATRSLENVFSTNVRKEK